MDTIDITTSDWQPAPSPVSSPLVAIGDVHGRSHLLRALHSHLARAAAPGGRVVYLGDLIDPHPRREIGPHDCADTVDAVATPIPNAAETVVLAGNHDAFFLIALEASRQGRAVPWTAGIWYGQGGAETAEAWGLFRSVLATPSETALVSEMWSRMSAAQRSVFEGMRTHAEHDAYVLVHAGFDPNTPIDRQFERANVLEYPSMRTEQQHPLWMRFKVSTDAAPRGRVLVHGHTPTRRPILGRKRICIDTGAKYGGPLTAIEIVDDRLRLHQAWPTGMTPARWHKDGLR